MALQAQILSQRANRICSVYSRYNNSKDNIMDAIALDINQRNSGHPDAIRDTDTEEAKRTSATPK